MAVRGYIVPQEPPTNRPACGGPSNAEQTAQIGLIVYPQKDRNTAETTRKHSKSLRIPQDTSENTKILDPTVRLEIVGTVTYSADVF